MRFFDIEVHEYYSVLILKNDEKRNSLSVSLLDEFQEALDEVVLINPRVLIIRSISGSEVWSAGFNINELPSPGKDPVPYDHPIELLVKKLMDLPFPVIAMIEGTVWGGGCDIAFSCDLLVGSPKTTFAITPAKIGVPYNTNAAMRVLKLLQPNIAKELFFTASPISAERAYELGILNHLVELEDLEEFTYNLAAQIAQNSPLAMQVIKKQINLLSGITLLNDNKISEIFYLRQKAYNSDDYLEGIEAFKQKRKAKFKGK